MSIFTWFRDLRGIKKDTVETKKAELETEKLKREQIEQDLIRKPTPAEIRKYDKKIKELEIQISREEKGRPRLELQMYGWVPFWFIILAALCLVIYKLWRG